MREVDFGPWEVLSGFGFEGDLFKGMIDCDFIVEVFEVFLDKLLEDFSEG